jgi:citrate lyase subunit beta/citryl-CoA lyase
MVNHIKAPLFVPATRPDRFEKAAQSGADAIILDLEDAVAEADKATARTNLTARFTALPVFVRINAAGTPWHEADVAALRAVAPAAVMLPKAEHPQQITALARTGLPVIALVETALGVANAAEIARAEGCRRLAFGSVDFCADLGCDHIREALNPARMALVMASRLAGIAPPIDGVTVQLQDLAETGADTRHARALGMTGKLCIHPKQVPEVLRGFAPTEADVLWAKRVLAAGDGAVQVDGQMIDAPVRLRAEAILSA